MTTFLAIFLVVYLVIFAIAMLMLVAAVLLDIRDELRRKRAGRLVALCVLLALPGCASAPKVIETPNVCPAPRTPPSLPALPQSLPQLTIGPNDDPAVKLLQNRFDSQAQYGACLKELDTLRAFVTP